MTPIKHPVEIGTRVSATKKSCACRGAKDLPVTGKVLKVIKNHTGTWYYLDCGVTVKADTVTAVYPT